MNRDDFDALLADYRPFHSEFQIDRLITAAAGGTPWGMYQQALREARGRFDHLRSDYIALAGKRIDLEEAEERTMTPDREGRRRDLEAARIRADIESLEIVMRDREREFARFVAQALVLRKSLGDLSEARKRELEEATWIHRAKVAAAEDYIAHGGLTHNTLLLVRSLPVRVRSRVLEEITSDPEALQKWWLAYEPDVPALEGPAAVSIEGLLCR